MHLIAANVAAAASFYYLLTDPQLDIDAAKIKDAIAQLTAFNRFCKDDFAASLALLRDGQPDAY